MWLMKTVTGQGFPRNDCMHRDMIAEAPLWEWPDTE